MRSMYMTISPCSICAKGMNDSNNLHMNTLLKNIEDEVFNLGKRKRKWSKNWFLAVKDYYALKA
jgi:hypothetical protein